jgi:5-methylcytosine-specific restriction endonuclease McrA
VRASDRQTLRTRYVFRCGYCGIREVDAGAELTVDHFQPRSQGGSDLLDNLVYCCPACNEYKGGYWQPNSPRRILHPLRDSLAEHFILTGEDTARAAVEGISLE